MLIKDLVTVIPARSGSKRVKGKNLKKIGGRFLIDHTINFCNKLEMLNLCFISSDSDEIRMRANGKVSAPFERPNTLCGDFSPDTGWLKHFINYIECELQFTPEYILILRPTSPIRSKRYVTKIIKKALNKKSAVRSVSRIPTKMSPSWSISKMGRGYTYGNPEEVVLRSQDLKPYFFPNGIADIVHVPTFLSTGLLYGHNFQIEEIDTAFLNDLDTQEDFKTLEMNFNELTKKVETYDRDS
jgi:CMP-N,N'-diacetyllegionaminic acid synthase